VQVVDVGLRDVDFERFHADDAMSTVGQIWSYSVFCSFAEVARAAAVAP
jgi:hypothetical protein